MMEEKIFLLAYKENRWICNKILKKCFKEKEFYEKKGGTIKKIHGTFAKLCLKFEKKI